MKPTGVIRGSRIFLKALTSAQVTSGYVEGLNDPEVNQYLVHVKRQHQTLQGVRAYVAADNRSTSSVLFGIFRKDSKTLIGTIRLTAIDRYHDCATIGICIFDKVNGWGFGFGSDAVKLVVDYAFRTLKLHYLEAGVYARNSASFKLFKKCDFTVRATFKDKYLWDGQFSPVHLYGLVNPRYKSPR